MEYRGRNVSHLKTALLSAALIAGAVFAYAGAGSAQTAAQLAKPDPQDWPIYGGSYSSQSYSQLRQVTPANAHNLQVKWVYHVPGSGFAYGAGTPNELEVTPIVYKGVMYISGYNRMDAIDARSGNVIWRYSSRRVDLTGQRGTTIYDNKVFVPTSDAHIVALDTRTGKVVWDMPLDGGIVAKGGALYVAKGKVIVGTQSQSGGAIAAYDAQTGQHVWTWYAVPKPGEPGSETWGTAPPGGADVWRSGSYDPEQNLYISGTGSPPTTFAGENRPGDNLHVDSIVALDIDTGVLKWYFQNVPHDVHDWDSQESIVLVDAVYKGQMRKLVLQAHRDGFYYILDRTNGKFLQGTPFIDDLNWASGLTPEGRPILIPGVVPTVQGNKNCPPTEGATNWPSASYSPQTRYFYVQSVEGCAITTRNTSLPSAAGNYIEDESNPWQSYLRAIDAMTGKKIWEYKEIRSGHYGPGVVSTAGGVVFSAQLFGQADMLDARNGKVLWHLNTGDVITASPISYGVDGQQFFAIVSGTNVFAFGLPDTAAPAKGGKP